MQLPASRTDRETMSEHEEDTEEEEEEEAYRGGPSAYAGPSGGTGTGRRHDRERSGRRDRSASRERSISPRSDRRSQASSAPLRPSKVTLVKSRKNEGGQHNVQIKCMHKDITLSSVCTPNVRLVIIKMP